MILLGLTGGIGAGKSAVSAMLAERGAIIIDADAVVRELQAPGQPLLQELATAFGDSIIAADGSLDRGALAEIAFKDKDALAQLNKIVHPAVGKEMDRRLNEQRNTDNISLSCRQQIWRKIRIEITIHDIYKEIEIHTRDFCVIFKN